MKSEKSSTPPATRKQAPLGEFALPDLKHYLMVVRERWFLAIFSTLLVTGLVGYYLLSDPPIYRASATLLMEPRQDRVVDMEGVVGDGLEQRGMEGHVIETHIQQMRSRSFVDRVANTFDEEQRNRIVEPYIEETSDGGVYRPSVTGLIRGNLNVQRVDNTLLLRIGVTHRDPESAALIANRVGEEYIRYLVDFSEAGNVSAIRFLNRQAENLGREVERMERELHDYRSENNLVSLEENLNIIAQQLRQVSDAVTSARMERIDIDARIDQIEEYKEAGEDLLEIEAIASFGSLPRLKQKREELEAEREAMSEKYLSRHPSMIENARNMETVQSQIDRNIDQAIQELRARQRNAHEHEARLRSELAAAEREAHMLDRLRVEYRVKEREVQAVTNTHDQILRRLDEANITSQLENSNIRLFEEASAPGGPSEPNIPRVAVILLFLGGLVFVGLPVSLDALNSRMRSWSDVEGYLGRSVIGEIPRVKKVKRALRANIVARELNDPTSIESFRSLYNQIGFASSLEQPKTMLVAGTVSGEGKTFVTCNLAATYAAHGRRTLIIDGDLRRPSIHREFGLTNKEGLMKFLQGEGTCEGDPTENPDLGLTEVYQNLYVLPGGGSSRKPTELFESGKAKEFFDWIKASFDIVLIDTPPLSIFSDAFNLVRYTDEVLYVCRFNGVNREQVKSFVDSFDQTGVDFLGLVMNEMPTNRSGSIYYSGRGYYSPKAYQKYYSKA